MDELLAQILRKRGSGLVKGSALVSYLDGVNDYGAIEGSGTAGNVLDFGRTDAFSLAGIVYPTDRNNVRFFEKRTSNSGYVFGTTTDDFVFVGFNTSSGLQGIRAASGYNYPNDPFTIFIATYDGSGSTNGFSIHQYRNTASFSATISNGAGTAVALGATSLGTGSLENTNPVLVGKNYPGGTALQTKAGLAHLSAWNKALSKAEADDLAMKMTTDNVSAHAAYGVNCVAYIREFVENLGVNAVNASYNLTITR